MLVMLSSRAEQVLPAHTYSPLMLPPATGSDSRLSSRVSLSSLFHSHASPPTRGVQVAEQAPAKKRQMQPSHCQTRDDTSHDKWSWTRHVGVADCSLTASQAGYLATNCCCGCVNRGCKGLNGSIRHLISDHLSFSPCLLDNRSHAVARVQLAARNCNTAVYLLIWQRDAG